MPEPERPHRLLSTPFAAFYVAPWPRALWAVPDPKSSSAGPKLSFGAKALWSNIASYAGPDGKCYPSREQLASDLGTTWRHVCQLLDELKSFPGGGLIAVFERAGRSNYYCFPRHPLIEASLRNNEAADTGEQPAKRGGEEIFMGGVKKSSSIVGIESFSSSRLDVGTDRDDRPQNGSQGPPETPQQPPAPAAASPQDIRLLSRFMEIHTGRYDETFADRIFTDAPLLSGAQELIEYCQYKISQGHTPRTNGYFLAIAKELWGAMPPQSDTLPSGSLDPGEYAAAAASQSPHPRTPAAGRQGPRSVADILAVVNGPHSPSSAS